MNGMLLALILLAAEGGAPAAGTQIDFDTQIVPILTRSGCNAGSCHGAAAGRGGFHLSLFGSDPAADFAEIVPAFEGRRIHRTQPAESLLLRKPTGYLDHGGGNCLDEDSAGAQLLRQWIAEGAERQAGRKLTRFEVSTSIEHELPLNEPFDLRASAWFDDERPAQVATWTVFTAQDPTAVRIDSIGTRAQVLRPGRHVILARYLDRVVPLVLVSPWPVSSSWQVQPRNASSQRAANWIDDEIDRTLAALRIPVSAAADDATFQRRVTLDLTGKLPTLEELAAFQADASPDKRERLVDCLLASDAWVDYWTLHFARVLKLHSLPHEPEAVACYSNWLREQIARGTSVQQWSRELLATTGDSHQRGPANFGRMVADARGQAELVGRLFLGARLGCANCHAHPFDRWTQDDYHGLAAVFGKLERGRMVRVASRGEITNPRTGEPAVPRVPGGPLYPEEELPSHEWAARWLTSADNDRFAQVTVNRLWHAMLGRGLVEPVDDLRPTNPPSNPALLQRLAADFVAHGYDLRHTLKVLALSQTYARSSEPMAGNSADNEFYSHARRRPLGPEVLADALADVTGVPTTWPGQPPGTQAVKLLDPLSPAPALDLLGRCSPASDCAEGQRDEFSLTAQLHWLNGQFVNSRLLAVDSRLSRALAQQTPTESLLREFFQRAYGRAPNQAEQQRWLAHLDERDPALRRQIWEDFLWSLLASRDFAENH
jgi:hypothetical protein